MAIGIDKIVPSEGIVFKYKDKIIKMTGIFAPANRILGDAKFKNNQFLKKQNKKRLIKR